MTSSSWSPCRCSQSRAVRRPFALLGFAAFFVLAGAACMGMDFVLFSAKVCGALGTCALLAAAAGYILRKRFPDHAGPGAILFGEGAGRLLKLLAVSAALLLTAALCLFRYQNAYETGIAPAETLSGREIRILGTVLDYPEEAYDKPYYRLRVERVTAGGKEMELSPFILRLSTRQPFPCEPYDTLECTVKVSAFDRSGGLFSVANSRWSGGAALGGYLSDYETVEVIPNPEIPFGKLFAQMRHLLGRSIERQLPSGEAALLRAMLLGERELVSDLTYSHFSTVGAVHLLVVSGLHMTVLAAFLFLLMGRLPIGRAGRNLLTAAAVLLFLCMLGFPVSAVRAGIMIILALLADSLGREPDGVNSLGFAMLVICLYNPFSGGSLSFALSAFSTLGVITLSGPIRGWLLGPAKNHPGLLKILTPVAASFGVTLGAMAATLPIQLLAFQGVSLMAPLANLILVFPCTVLLYAALLTALLGLLPLAGPALPFAFCAGWLARFAMAAAGMLVRVPLAYLSLNDADAFLWVAAAGALVLSARLLVRREPGAWALIGVVLLMGCSLWELIPLHGQTVTLAASGDSSCIALIRGRSAAVFIRDGYRTAAPEELLARNNIFRVEALCLPDRSTDARKAAAALLERYPVKRLVLPGSEYSDGDLAEEAALLYPGEGERISLLDGVEATARDGMGRLEFTVNGVDVVVETGNTGEGECQVLFTDQTPSRINSPFTVCQSDAIIDGEVGPEGLPALGMIPGGEGLYIDLLPDGAVRLRGESQCLNWMQPN